MKDAETFLVELGFQTTASQVTETALNSTEVNQSESNAAALSQQIEAKAVALLAMREHGGRELKKKLLTKFPETDELLTEYGNLPGLVKNLVDEVLELCRNNNWQSDERYVEQAVRNYMAKGHGPMKIQQKLQQNCTDGALISAALDLDEMDWVGLAQSVLEKKYGDYCKPTVAKEQAKRMRFLQSRGFPQSTIWKAFR